MSDRALGLVILLGALTSTSCSGETPDEPDLPPTTAGDMAEAEVLREITLQDDVVFPENDIALADATVFPDHIVFRYEGEPTIVLAPANVIVGVLDGGYMRRITDLGTASDGTLLAQTEHATLLDVIADGHFRLTVSSEEIITMGELMDSGVGMGSEPLNARGAFSIIPPSESGEPGPCEGMISGEFFFEPGLTYNREVIFEVDISFLLRLRSYRFIVDNALRVSFSTGARAALEAACNVDLIEVINRRRRMMGLGDFAIERVTYLQVGFIPVVLTHTFTPIFEMGLSLNLDAEARFDAFGQAGARVGLEWDRDTGTRFIYEPLNDGGATLTTEAVAALEAGVTAAGLSYQLKLWDAIGPTLTLTGSLVGHAEADLAACEWTTWIDLGGNFNLRGSIELPVIDHEIFSVEHDWPFPTREFARSSGAIGGGCGMPDAGSMDGGGTDSGTDAGPMMSDAGPPTDAGPPPFSEFPVTIVPVAGGANFRMGLAAYAVPIVVRFGQVMEDQAVDASILQVNPTTGALIPLTGGFGNVGAVFQRPLSTNGWHPGAGGANSEIHLVIPGNGPTMMSQWIFGMVRASGGVSAERFVLRIARASTGAPLRRAGGIPISTGPIEVPFSATMGSGPGTCTPGSSCAADFRWCCSSGRCELAAGCTVPGAFELGGCACCSGPNPFMPLACDFCYSSTLEDVFGTFCPGG